MTQERKDELYDQMIAWICEQHGDEELFQLLCGQFGMSKEELHDHCIESLDSFFPEGSPRERLAMRVADNFQEYQERWMQMEPWELIECCEVLASVTRMAEELPERVNEEEARFLLRFQDPLKLVCDVWINKNGTHARVSEEAMTNLLRSLRDHGVDENVYALAPEHSQEAKRKEASPESQREKRPEEDARERFYDELQTCLARNGFTSGEEDNGLLPVFWQDEPLCRVTAGGGIQYRKDEVDREGGSEALDRVIDMAATTAEYMRMLETSPPLKAQGLEGDYRLLADFNGTVLAAHPTGQGTEFVTWEWDYPHTGMWQGHYYGTNYAGAKQDFALRSGLIPQTLLFEPEQLQDLYRCCEKTLELDESLTYLDAERLTSLEEKIEAISPGIGDRVEEILRQEQEAQTKQEQTMY